MPSYLPLPHLSISNPSPLSPSSSTAAGSSLPLLPRSLGKLENPPRPGSRWKKGKSTDLSKSALLSLGKLTGYKEIAFSSSWVSEYRLIMVLYVKTSGDSMRSCEDMEDCLKPHQSPQFCSQKMALELGQW
ncbi:hypothetical protein AMTRI_Chr04g184970 [Amborella trichopoda]